MTLELRVLAWVVLAWIVLVGSVFAARYGHGLPVVFVGARFWRRARARRRALEAGEL